MDRGIGRAVLGGLDGERFWKRQKRKSKENERLVDTLDGQMLHPD